MGKVYEFRPRGKIVVCCCECGGHFVQREPHHRFCTKCYWWDVGLRARDVMIRAFRELRAGGGR